MPRLPALACVALLALAGSPGNADPVRADPLAIPGGPGRLIEALAAQEYQASLDVEGLQAPNRRHDLRTYFGRTGIRVVDRTAAGSPRLVALSLSRWGREASWIDATPGEVGHTGTRVEIARPGLLEWYENSEAGLEQGFTLTERPAGQGELRLELAVDGAATQRAGDELAFESDSGRGLRYRALRVTDAAGVDRAARFALVEGGFRIAVSDADAAYPLTIDPLLTATPDAVLESNQANAQLGGSVASAGDVNGDGYEDVIVGAISYDAGQSNEGAAFVFLGSASGIADGNPLTADAQLESNAANALFGWSVASAGDVNGDGYADVIVGARSYSGAQPQGGAAFVFLGSASGIADGSPATAHARLDSDQGYSRFGQSVASAGDVNGDGYADVIVGAPWYDWSDPSRNEGAAFVFLGSAVGIPDATPATAHATLEVYRFGAQMGESVASAGDVNGDGYGDVIVGAYSWGGLYGNEGGAFLYLGSAAGITTLHARLQSKQVKAYLGQSVASAGDVNGDGYGDVIVGAPYYDAGQDDEGAAFVFLGSATGIPYGTPAEAHARLEGDQEGCGFGTAVASAGDVNGDGYADVIVGAPSYSAGQLLEGAAFVFFGSAAGIADGSPATADAQIEGDKANARFGTSVASAGDVNDDGAADVIAGAPNYNAGQAYEGAALVYLPEPAPSWQWPAGAVALVGVYRLRRREKANRRRT